MKPQFTPATAETMEEFLNLMRGWKLVVCYVHDGPIGFNPGFELPDVEPGELYLSFDLAKHGEASRRRFREVSALELRLGDPPLRPLPYWHFFIVGMGPYSTVYSIEDARAMVLRAREETQILWKAFEK